MLLFVNHEYKAIFLHNPKVAGSYIHNILRKHYNFKLITYNKSIKEHLEFIEHQHLDIIDKIFIVNQIRNKGLVRYYESVFNDPLYKNYYKFVFVRNPYNRIISAWSFCKKISTRYFLYNTFPKKNDNKYNSYNNCNSCYYNEKFYDNEKYETEFLLNSNKYEKFLKIIDDFGMNEIVKYMNDDTIHIDDYTFDEYLRNGPSTCTDYSYFHSFITQTDHLINNDNKIDFNYIGKFENLNEDLLNILKNIGITKFTHIESKEDTPMNISQYSKPNAYYLTPENITIINKLFEKDFTNFNYEMKEGA